MLFSEAGHCSRLCIVYFSTCLQYLVPWPTYAKSSCQTVMLVILSLCFQQSLCVGSNSLKVGQLPGTFYNGCHINEAFLRSVKYLRNLNIYEYQ